MDKTSLRTQSGARMQSVQVRGKENLHWLFLPGGPGLGSESLMLLCESLQLPGTIWRLDLPGDGSNTTVNNYESFSHWSCALIEAVSQFKQVILVAHSTGGMYALSEPKLENFLKGLVLLDSALDTRWQVTFRKTLEKSPIYELEKLQEEYKKCPNNETLKQLTIASAPLLFTEEGLKKGIKMLQTLPYNCDAYQWSDQHFDHIYQAKWVPKNIPTLILAGEKDRITPLSLFNKAKEFHRENIHIESIKNGGHFPWIEDPLAVAAAFNKYYNRFNATLS